MLLHHLITAILNAAQTAPTVCPNDGVHPLCPGSAVTAIAAAYGTQGMWVMADLVDQMLWTPLAAIGPLVYLIAAAGGIVSLALGAPPRMYLWFFLGPAIFRWLIGTSVPALGMEWKVAGQAVDQRQV